MLGSAVPVYQRFIPTHVGNGEALGNLYGYKAVHPHACGERPSKAPARPAMRGSSPRMWGTGHKSKE